MHQMLGWTDRQHCRVENVGYLKANIGKKMGKCSLVQRVPSSAGWANNDKVSGLIAILLLQNSPKYLKMNDIENDTCLIWYLFLTIFAMNMELTIVAHCRVYPI